MTLDCILLALTELNTARLVGLGVVSPEARYAVVLTPTGPRRLHVCPEAWQQVESELRDGLPPGPLPSTSALHQIVTLSSGHQILSSRYLARLPIAVGSGTVATTLDRVSASLMVEFELRRG